MKSTFNTTIAVLALGTALAAPALAQDHAAHAGHHAAPAAATSTDTAMTAGEVTRVDARTGKLTIRHEDIKNLGMPAMTMVFELSDAAKAVPIKAGDKVLFQVESKEGALVIARIQTAP